MGGTFDQRSSSLMEISTTLGCHSRSDLAGLLVNLRRRFGLPLLDPTVRSGVLGLLFNVMRRSVKFCTSPYSAAASVHRQWFAIQGPASGRGCDYDVGSGSALAWQVVYQQVVLYVHK